MLLLYLHILTCFIFYIMVVNKTWVPPAETLLLGLEFYETHNYFGQYWTCMYYAVLMYLVNETAPTILEERIFV